MKPKLMVWLSAFLCIVTAEARAQTDGWVVVDTQATATTNSAGIFVRTGHERVVMKAQVAAKVGGRVVATYDCRVVPRNLNTNGMSGKETYEAVMANSVPFTAGYFRGQVALSQLDGKKRKETGQTFEQWVTVFSSGDRRKLVVAWDEGPISISTNFGTTWKTLTALGQYDFTLSATPNGSALFAKVGLGKAQSEVISRVASIVNNTDWYLAATAADGTRLVIAGGASKTPPALLISPSGTNLNFSWSIESPGFALQRSTAVEAVDWLDVTNSVNPVSGKFQVTLPQSEGTGFFRLNKH